MSRHIPLLGLLILIALSGCQPQMPFYAKPVSDDLQHYRNVATEISYPNVETDRTSEVAESKRPWSLQNLDTAHFWDLTLEEAVKTALANNKVMRNIGAQIQGSPEFILRNPETAPTIYDPALAEANPRTGTEAALSAFDAQFATSLMWQKVDQPTNYLNGPFVDSQDVASFQNKLSKVTAAGGTFALSHEVKYDFYKSSYYSYTYPSQWNVNLTAEARQPLLRGAGAEFNRINGPGTSAGPGNYNGVMIARIRTDIALAEFESAVQSLVRDVEVAYWELYFDYRNLDTVKSGRDSTLATWRRVETLFRMSQKGGERDKEAQAREQYYLFLSNAQQALNTLYAAEAKLRYMMGLSPTDGRLIRPKDEPTTAKVVFDWYDIHAEALARNVALREEKQIVKQRELELIAAKNFLLPQLDAVAQYEWVGLGNDLFAVENGAGSNWKAARSSAYSSLTSGDFAQWQYGLQFSMPIGFRKENAGVRHAEMALAKERMKLQEGELELTHQLSDANRDLEHNYVQTQTNFNRRFAAQKEVEAMVAAYETDAVTLDLLLRAQQTLAVAEAAYYRSLVDYSKSIMFVHLRKGSLLEYNGVYLSEGPWPGKAYFDARRRARARAAATPIDYGYTLPRAISRGPYEQHAGAARDGDIFPNSGSEGVESSQPTPAGRSTAPSPAETIPAPEPEATESSPSLDAIPPEPLPASSRSQGNGRTAVKLSATEPKATEPKNGVADNDWGRAFGTASAAKAKTASASANGRSKDGWSGTYAKSSKAAGSARTNVRTPEGRAEAKATPVAWTAKSPDQQVGGNDSVVFPESSAADADPPASGWRARK